MANSSLAAIRTKVRRITRSPSTNQISDADIDEYVNTFIQYDMPEHLRLFSLRTNLKFFTQPYVDTYSTVTAPATNPLFNFKNVYTTVHEPVYIAGYQAFYSQSQAQFFNIYPKNQSIVNTGQTGNGVAVAFAGTIPGINAGSVLLKNNVSITSKDTNENGLVVKDVPVDNINGSLVVPDSAVVVGTINYITGAFTVTFATAPANAEPIRAEVVITVPARPTSILYYDDVFTIRPVPDRVYSVEMEAYIRPTELLAAGISPELEQWWQYVVYGAAIKIFQDRMNMDSVALVMPEFKLQERLVQRRTILQNTNERTATIYTEQVNYGNFGDWWNNGSF